MTPTPCIVRFCKNKGTHCFPSDEARKAQWIQAIELKKPRLAIRKYSRICSEHFRPTDFNITPLFLLKSGKFILLLCHFTHNFLVNIKFLRHIFTFSRCCS